MKRDAVRGMTVLLAPEAVVELNAQGAEILLLCDGTRSEDQIVDAVRRAYAGGGEVEVDVRAFLSRVRQRGWVEIDPGTDPGA